MSEIVIKPLTEGESYYYRSDFAFDLPCRVIFVAPSHSGKSVLIENIFANPKFDYYDLFESNRNVFVMSPTYKSGSMKIKGLRPENIRDHLDSDLINAIMEEQEENIREYGKEKSPNVAIIIDDLIAGLTSHDKNVLRKLYFHGRHAKISTFLTSQSYKSIPKSVRVNADHSIIFQINNTKEMMSIVEEQNVDEGVFRWILNHATEQPYSFLKINHKKPINERYSVRMSNQTFKIV
jgi:hypothetical protein